MGGKQNKTQTSKLEDDILKINLIAKNELFKHKTGLTMYFQKDFHISYLRRLFLSEIIHVNIVSI
jgi:hypothetical protein